MFFVGKTREGGGRKNLHQKVFQSFSWYWLSKSETKCDFQCETSPDHLLLYMQTDLGLLSRKTKSNIGAGHQTSFLSKALNSIWHIVSQGFWTRIVRERTRSGFWTQKRLHKIQLQRPRKKDFKFSFGQNLFCSWKEEDWTDLWAFVWLLNEYNLKYFPYGRNFTPMAKRC